MSKSTSQKAILNDRSNEHLLFQLSTAVASIKNRQELFSFIVDKVQPLFGFNQYTNLCAYKKDTNELYIFLTKMTEEQQQQEDINKFIYHFKPEGIFDTIINSDEVVITDESWKTSPKRYPIEEASQKIWNDLDFNYCLNYRLQTAGKLIGTFHVHFFEAKKFSQEQLENFKSICNLIAVAVANILATEEILQKEREKSQLLSISEQLATIRDKHELFSVIFNKLQPIFNFDEAVVALCDADREYTQHLHTTQNDDYLSNNHYQIIMSEKIPVKGTPYQEFLFNELPQIYNLPYFQKHYPNHVGVKILTEFGLVESVLIPLKYGGKVLGTFEFHSKSSKTFSDSQLPLFKSLGEQIAVTVANILANEEIVEREREKSLLLSISEELALVRDRKELWNTITEKVRPVFKFDDAVITQIDWEKGEYFVFTFNSLSQREGEILTQITTTKIKLPNSAYQYTVEQIRNGTPLHITTEKFRKKFPDDGVVKMLTQMNLNDSLFMCLKHQGKILGSINFHYEKEGAVNENKYLLAQNFANQVASTVANILANEEILKRETEKSLLLSLSESLSEVKDKHELINVILDKVKTIIPFDDNPGIFVVDEKLEYYYLYYNKFYSDKTDNELLLKWKTSKSLIEHDPIAKHFLFGDKIQISRLKDWVKKLPNHTGVKIASGFNHLETLHLQLFSRGKLIGLLSLNANQEGTFDNINPAIAKSVAEHIANTLANILANEEIVEREREKSLLLEIAQKIASIFDAEKLFEAFGNIIRPLFGCDDIVIFIVNEKEQYSYPFVYNGEDNRLGHPSYKFLKSQKLPLAGSLEEWIIRHNYPFVIPLTEMLQLFPDEHGLLIMEDFGLKHSMMGNLEVGGKIVGSLHIHSYKENFFKKESLSLFKGICDLFAPAIANILATEEILEREREKTMLLSLSEDMASIRDRQSLWQVMTNKIREFLAFDDAVVIVFKDEKKLSNTILTVSSGERTTQKWYQHIYNNWITVTPPMAYIYSLKEPYWSTDEMLDKFPDFEGCLFMKSQNLMHTYQLILVHGGKEIGILLFHYPSKMAINFSRENLYKSIASQVSVAVANILANEEITENEKQKSLLLQLSGYINNLSNRNDLLITLGNKIQPLLGYDEALITLYDDKMENFIDYFTNTNKKVASEPVYTENVGMWHSINDTPHEVVLQFLAGKTGPEPVVNDLSQLQNKYKNFYGFQICNLLGYKTGLNCALIYSGKLIGTLGFLSTKAVFFRESEFAFYRSLADIVAASVANIIANEEIQEREKEKTLLLNLANKIGTIKNKNELWQAILNVLQPALGFEADSSFVNVLLPDKKHYRCLLVSDAVLKNKNSPFHRIMHQPETVKGKPYEQIIKKEVWIFNIADQLKKYPDFEGLMFAKKGGMKQMAIIRLEHGGEIIGSIHFNSTKENSFSERQIPLFKRIGSQVSAAIVTILANEEIFGREKISSFQVNTIEKLNKGKSWQERIHATSLLLLPHVPFHFLYCTPLPGNGESGYGFMTISPNELQYVSKDNLQRLFKTNNEIVSRNIEALKQSEKLKFSDTKSFHEQMKKTPFIKMVAEGMQLKSVISIPVFIENSVLFSVHLFHTSENFYTEQHFSFFEKVSPAITETLVKNIHLDEIARLKNMLERENKLLEYEKEYLQQEINAKYNFEQIVGISEAMQSVFERIRLVAPTDSTVLLEGETGTGKELIARAIHNLSRRKNKPLIKVNCAALPSALVESELFGHEKGSFTGALEKRLGKFELANGGTLFLDEIGDLSPEIQPKLLRVLQEMEVDRIGSKAPIKIDVRIIAATNKNLEEECGKKTFRPDLYYRLNTFPIGLPPLRERKEDIPLLADYFMNVYAKKIGKKIKSLSSNCLKELMAYGYPGNVRELEHIIENSVIFCKSHMLELGRPLKSSSTATNISDLYLKTLDENEKDYIHKVLKTTKGRIRGRGGAAEILNIHPNTLESRMKKLGMNKTEY